MSLGELNIYTDGSCLGNPGPGGWASLFITKDAEIIATGGTTITTNNRMEIMAVIAALYQLLRCCGEKIDFLAENPDTVALLDNNSLTDQTFASKATLQDCRISLFADSQYVLRSITEWCKTWQQRGWRTANKKPVVNKDLWLIMIKLTTLLTANGIIIDWNKVSGHSGHKQNDQVDQAARAVAQQFAEQVI